MHIRKCQLKIGLSKFDTMVLIIEGHLSVTIYINTNCRRRKILKTGTNCQINLTDYLVLKKKSTNNYGMKIDRM